MPRSRFALLAAVGLLAACGGRSSTSPTTEPPGTAARTTIENSSTTAGPTTTAPTTESGVLAWLEEQQAEGRAFVFVDPDTSGARLATAYSTSGDSSSVVVLADGTVVTVDAPRVATALTDAHVRWWGDRLALVQRGPSSARLDLFDPATGEWQEGPDLGLDGPFGNTWIASGVVAGYLMVVVVTWGPGDGTEPAAQAGAVVAPDLSVRPMAEPQNPNVPMLWTLEGERLAVLLALETQAYPEYNLKHPWAFDPAANVWREVPNPPWVDCERESTCGWYSLHEGGDFRIWQATPYGMVTSTPDGLALLDEATFTWTRLPDPPFSPAGSTSRRLDDGRIVVFPMSLYEAPEEWGTVGILDPATATWTTLTLDVQPIDPTADYPLQWVVRQSANSIIIATSDDWMDPNPTPTFAIDNATGDLRPANAADLAAWQRLLAGDFRIADLILSWTEPTA